MMYNCELSRIKLLEHIIHEGIMDYDGRLSITLDGREIIKSYSIDHDFIEVVLHEEKPDDIWNLSLVEFLHSLRLCDKKDGKIMIADGDYRELKIYWYNK